MRRQKTYSAQSGYVYQYFYEGYRATGAATEFVFDVSSDRKSSFHVPVLLSDNGTAAWEKAHSRDLNSTERYAIAKMALFAAFDGRQNPDEMKKPVPVDAENVEEILAALDFA